MLGIAVFGIILKNKIELGYLIISIILISLGISFNFFKSNIKNKESLEPEKS